MSAHGAQLARQIATTVLSETGEGQQMPVNVIRIASRMGVSEISLSPIALAGRLDQRNGATRIVVRKSDPPRRQRFTIAHELGHLCVNAWAEAGEVTPVEDEERFCDAFAAALLLPEDRVRYAVARSPARLDTLRTVADRSRVSWSATLLRLAEVSDWRLSLMRWRRDAASWRLAGVVNGPRDSDYAPNPLTTKLLDRIAPERIVTTLLPLDKTDQLQHFVADVWVSGRSAVALLDHRAGMPFGREFCRSDFELPVPTGEVGLSRIQAALLRRAAPS